MKHLFTLLLVGTSIFSVDAQITPDLIKGDFYRIYLSETQKQDEILSSGSSNKPKYPQTSRELYPELYKYDRSQDANPFKGTSLDPFNAVQLKGGYTLNTTSSPNAYQPQSPNSANSAYLQSQREIAAFEAEKAAYEAQRANSAKVLEAADKELEKIIVKYNLGEHSGERVAPFVVAYSELEAMLTGGQKIDFLRAVWLVESAVDASLSWEEFNGMFYQNVQVIQQLMKQDKVSLTDNLSKIMAIYKYMADTTSVYMPNMEKTIVSKPMLYDYEDFKAEKDITKVFVSKLLRTGSGQCMSLPMLYYLFSKALGAEAYITFSPQHSHITFKDNDSKWQHIELTGKMFTTADFYWSSGFINGEQVRSGIYLRPITEKETIAYLLTTLSLSYIKTFGVDDLAFDMAFTAGQHFPKSLTANMILTGYSHELWKHVLRQYAVKGLSDEKLAKDEKAQRIRQQKEMTYNHIIKKLGYTKIPDQAYKEWLDGVNALANKRQHLVKRRELEQQIRK